jgi:alpha-tubulin suppressor-like RCC1 family protein/tRNA A-37 threonylcarbamoyl transferase component Bud32
MTDRVDAHEVVDLGDQYELLGELGRGASAVVYRARDRYLGRLVAIKLVRPQAIASGHEAMERLAREARTVARLHHPNIVTVHAVQRVTSGGLALVMQLVPGQTLKASIESRGPLPPDEAERILRDIASALAYAHAHGVVHRDVKPENIFIDAESGRAMLSDFGIALSSDQDSRLTMTGAAIGTPAYMAPEQIDSGRADARSDLYSLGLVAWEMLTGRRPWAGESLYSVISKQKTEELPAIDALRPGEVPERLQYLIERMLQKKPGARLAGADALVAKLEQWVVPADWPQWQAAHRRRREAVLATRAAAVEAKARETPSGMATIRFRRPTDGASAAAGAAARGGAGAGAAGAPPASDLDDPTPSWSREAVRPVAVRAAGGRGVAIGVSALLVLVASGALAWAARSGRLPGLAERLVGGEGASPVAVASSPRTLLGGGAREDAPGADSAPDVPSGDSAPEFASPGAAGLIAQTETSYATEPTLMDRAEARPLPVVRSDSVANRAAGGGGRGAAGTRRSSVAVSGGGSPAAGIAAPAIGAEESTTVVRVRATGDVGMVAAGGRHSCTLSGGQAYCWGANDRGQLGDGDQETRDVPTPVVGEIELAQLSAGLAHTCGTTRGGEAYCWGAGERGQLGDATTTSRGAPVRVAGRFLFRSVRTGNNHSCGLTTGGEVACWGANSNGQLGDGGTGTRSVPVRVASDLSFIAVATGWNHSCAIAADGSAWCWGANADGQLGTGSPGDQRTPQRVASALRFTAIGGGGTHTCAVSDEGDVWCWGRNHFGQLGSGGTVSQPAPVRVVAAGRFVSVALGGVHSCARTSGGEAWCWGRNVYGQLGDGTTVDRDRPVRVVGGSAFAALSVSGAHTCGTTSAGEVSCWGFNVLGQLGDGTRNHLARPSRVALPGR